MRDEGNAPARSIDCQYGNPNNISLYTMQTPQSDSTPCSH